MVAFIIISNYIVAHPNYSYLDYPPYSYKTLTFLLGNNILIQSYQVSKVTIYTKSNTGTNAITFILNQSLISSVITFQFRITSNVTNHSLGP